MLLVDLMSSSTATHTRGKTSVVVVVSLWLRLVLRLHAIGPKKLAWRPFLAPKKNARKGGMLSSKKKLAGNRSQYFHPNDY
jgi:hypothetical protein